MPRTISRPLAVLALLAFACWPTRAARAYCRETTVAPDDGCECSDQGLPLFWPDETVQYAFNERGFPGLSEAELRKVIARSFAHWTDVRCEQESVVLSIEAQLETTPMGPEHQEKGPNLNTIVYLSEKDFLAAHGDPHAFALTTTTIHETTGEIIDADLIFNDGLGPFTICPERGCNDGSVDIENVATHELGHFLGLAHSKVPASTMECSALPGQTNKRSLESDDRAGICAIYSPPAVEERTEALYPEHVTGCGCRLAEQPSSARARNRALRPSWHAAPALSLALLGLFALRRRRHR